MTIPFWLTVLAWVWLMSALACAVVTAADELRHPQAMAVMNVVWPVTALYGSVAALWGYFAAGRGMAKDGMPGAMHSGEHTSGKKRGEAARPTLRQMAIAASHCEAGCMLADIAGETLVYRMGWKVGGESLYAEYLVTLGLAWLFGVAFQYFSIQPMTQMPPGKAVVAAIRADTLSIVFFQMGMYGWMALVYFLLFPHPHLRPDEPAFWFPEQVGMMVGFVTTMPVNGWLVRRGVKEAM